MTFIVALIALVIERFFDWSHLRQWHWYTLFQQMVMKKIPEKFSYLILVMSILPLLFVVGIGEWLLKDSLYGFAALIYQLVILLYCLGPQNLWVDAFSCINVLVQGDGQALTKKLKTSAVTSGSRTVSPETSYSRALHKHLLNDIFIEANRRFFAIIFWYFFLGPVGAVLYRTVTLSASEVAQETTPELAQSARYTEGLLDWLPVRVFTFIFALGGHFVQVINCWRKNVFLGWDSNEILLTECGIAALGCEGGELPEGGLIQRNALNLIDRVLVIVLILIAVLGTWG